MIGFRRGTSLPFYPYDFEEGVGYKVLQIPLLVMDVTLKNNMNLSAEDALKQVNKIIDEVIEYGGVFSLLWHPGNCSDEWKSWLDRVYFPVLNRLKHLRFHSLRGEEIHEIVDKM
jgi:2,4-dienoyl-CoA reductase-like NADH-dependent reductase (Old Yellow Enzyme family)